MFELKFNINDYPGRVAMQCETPEEAQAFCEYLDSIGHRWLGGQSYRESSEWHVYGDKTCYSFNTNTFADVAFYKCNGYAIMKYSDFDWSNTFTKADLRNGDVVLRRNGSVEIVIVEHNALVSRDGFNRLSELSDTLKDIPSGGFPADEEWDVIAVRRPVRPSDCLFTAFDDELGELVFSR